MADADPTQSVTDQFQGFESLDDIVVRGLTLQDFSFSLADNSAHNQLTITAAQIANPAIETNIVISGHSTADVNAGRLQLAFSSDWRRLQLHGGACRLMRSGELGG